MPIKKINPILLTVISMLLIIYLTLQGTVINAASAAESDTGSTIAGIKISGLNEKEMEDVLQQGVNKWITEKIVVNDGEREVLIDPSKFNFDINATIALYENTVDKPWYAFWESDRIVHLPLIITIPEEVTTKITEVSGWDKEKTLNVISIQASYLKEHEIKAVVNDLKIDNERIALSIESIPTEAMDVEAVAELLNGTILYSNDSFSFIEKVGETTANREAKNFVASLLYDAVLHTEFEILERHAQEKMPSYLEPGINASINIQYTEDLQFLNSSTSAVQINATVEGSNLKVEIYSNEKGKDVLVQTNKEEISPRIIIRYSDKLSVGQKQLVQEGQKGVRVVVTRVISESGSRSEEQISRDYYAPTNRIVLVSSKQAVQSTTPNTTDSSNNNNSGAPSGNTQTGTNGTDTNTDPDTQIDLDNNDLPDMTDNGEEELPEGSYYDKGGNLITP